MTEKIINHLMELYLLHGKREFSCGWHEFISGGFLIYYSGITIDKSTARLSPKALKLIGENHER